SKGFAMNLWSGYRSQNQKTLRDIIVRGCEIHVPHNGFQGIALIHGRNILIENNTIYNDHIDTAWSIVLESNRPVNDETYESTHNTMQNVVVRNNVCIGSGIAALGQGLINNRNISISGNHIEVKNDNSAFQAYMIHDLTFEDNDIIF